MSTIAGHTFVYGVCECGRKRSDIRGTTMAHVGMEGIAHRGGLTEAGAQQIMEADAEESRRMEMATGWYRKPPEEAPSEPDGAWPAPGAPLKWTDIGDGLSVRTSPEQCGYIIPELVWRDIPTSDGGSVKWVTTVDYRPVMESAACRGCGGVFLFQPSDEAVPDLCCGCCEAE